METRLKELRIEKSYSQLYLASILGISQSTVSKLELGELHPTADIICRYSDHFHVTTDYILHRSNEKISIDALLNPEPSLSTRKNIIQILNSLNSSQIMKLCIFLASLNISE